jgi:hypothetical protein
MKHQDHPKALSVGMLRSDPHGARSPCIVETGGDNAARPEGLEPPTLGSEDRCSIRLSYRRPTVFAVFFAVSRGILEVVSDVLRL